VKACTATASLNGTDIDQLRSRPAVNAAAEAEGGYYLTGHHIASFGDGDLANCAGIALPTFIVGYNVRTRINRSRSGHGAKRAGDGSFRFASERGPAGEDRRSRAGPTRPPPRRTIAW
jgi:hypothetical protein